MGFNNTWTHTLSQNVVLWRAAISSVEQVSLSHTQTHAHTHAHVRTHTYIPFTLFHQRVWFDKVERALPQPIVKSKRRHWLVPSSGLWIITTRDQMVYSSVLTIRAFLLHKLNDQWSFITCPLSIPVLQILHVLQCLSLSSPSHSLSLLSVSLSLSCSLTH